MKQYKTVNNLIGWITFIIAATVYCMTIEPTASFWDCPEFITTGYKLEVGHPPGAPFFMLVANLFSQFASDATTVAKMVNYMSALMSAACILFLFWSITHLVRKLVVNDENNITKGQLITIMGSGLVGALAYTFSDTFWFSAVEGEVYAFSSLFTAVVFWLILKWEDVADEPHSDRWLILIAYLTGLSIGVHLLNLLCLPAIVLVYYYKKVPNANAKGSLLASRINGAGGSRIVRHRSGHCKSRRLVRAALRQHTRTVLQQWCHRIYHPAGSLPHLGRIRKLYRKEQVAHGTLVHPDHSHAGYSFLRTWRQLCRYRHHRHRIAVALSQAGYAGEDQREISRIGTHTEHITIMHHDDCHRIFIIRTYRDPLHRQHTDGPELSGGHLHAGRIPGTRAIWYTPAVLRSGILLTSSLDVKDGYCEPRISYNGTKYIRKEKASADEKDSYIEIPGRIEYEYAQNMLFPRMYSSTHANQYQAWQDIKDMTSPTTNVVK